MAVEVNTSLDKKVIPLLKKADAGELKRGELVDAMVKAGVPKAQVSLFMYRLEHVADPSLKLKATPAAVKNARTPASEGGLGLRWERIAYRTGLVDSEGSLGAAVNKVKELYEKGGGDLTAYVGRGRDFSGVERSTPKRGAASTGKRSTAKRGATSGRRAKADSSETPKRGAAGKRGGAKRSTAKRGSGKRGTRAQAGADPR